MKKLGFGLMRLPLKDKEDASAIDQEQLNQMVDLFWKKDLPILIRHILIIRE